jgi:hypothetical protein
MTHINFIYIHAYRNLKDISLSFDPQHEYSFDQKSSTLRINPSSCPIPENFWGNGIWGLSGLFGDNGAGKTTVLRFVLSAVIDGIAGKSVDGIVVYELDGKLFVYQHIQKEVKIISELDVCTENVKLPNIETFYFSGHFMAAEDYADPCTVELSGLYNASEGVRFKKDIEKYSNSTDSYAIYPYASYLVSYLSQNNFRICNLLVNKELRDKFEGFAFPRYIRLSPNKGGQSSLMNNPLLKDRKEKIKDCLIPKPIRGVSPLKEELISFFLHFNFLNAIVENPVFKGHEWAFTDWYNKVDTSKDVLGQFHQFVKSAADDIRDSLDAIYRVVSALFQCAYHEDTRNLYLDTDSDSQVILDLLALADGNRQFITMRYFDMYYSHSVEAGTTLSSGEQAFLDLFSRLYDAATRPSTFGNLSCPSLLILDEAEIGFHPEWQRKYVKTLLDFIHCLKVKAGHDFQIIISSHSPLLLSDIPVACSNFLQKKGYGTINTKLEQKETFASNVFELYRNAFFLENGLVGAFAQEKVKDWLRRAKDEKDMTVFDEIAIVGDERLRKYLEDELLKRIGKQMTIKYYEDKLKELKEGE